MAKVNPQSGSGDGGLATELSSKYLPGVEYGDLPEPLSLRKILGPSVILLATSIGSGEFVLWPFISAQVGLVLMWAAMLGIFLQFIMNMEIERYTLATGETAVTGFTRLWPGWAPIFVVFTVVPWFFPGWATGAATTLSFVGVGSASSIELVTVLLLVAIGIALTASPVVYQAVEKLEFVLVAVVVVFLAIAIFIGSEASAWGEFVTGFSQVGRIPSGIDAATLLGAIAFAGAGGTVNLAQSNWLRDKGMGMGAHMPRIVSPITGEEEAAPGIGVMFRPDEANLKRWDGWWKVANQEQFWTFFVIGALSIIILSVLTVSTVGGEDVGEGFDFIKAEGEALRDVVGPGFGVAFWLTGTAVLLSTNIGVLDHVGRVVADIFKVNWLRDSSFWSESKIYFSVVWLEVVLGGLTLLVLPGDPVLLLVIASAMNGFVMFFYAMLLTQLNRTSLPSQIKVSGGRLVFMGVAILFFGFFSAFALIKQVLPAIF